MSGDVKPTTPAPEGATPASPAPSAAAGFGRSLRRQLFAALDRPMPDDAHSDPERARRARLIARFGLVGALFGIVYATFYLLIGNDWGALVILFCSSGFGITPWIMRRKKSIEPAGHFLVLTLTLGFTALCFLEGGLRGHAIAWLVSVPLCALLLIGQRAAKWWTAAASLAAGIVAGFDLAGYRLTPIYNPKLEPIVSAAGYMGLIIFMFILGWIFEAGRANAFAKMQSALQDLAVSNERLVHLNNEKNEFLGIAAHDLKNPLTAILGGVEMLRGTTDAARITKLANMIGSAASRMRHLVMDLLDANAIEQGNIGKNIEPCDLGELAAQCVEHSLAGAVKKSIEIRVGTSPGLWAKGDRAATMQIIENLISNAVKYSPPNTTVHVHTMPEKEHVMVSVRDEGPGISEEDQKKLFQKYTKLTARPTGGESSTGLGLSIVKKLAEAMSGTVQCYSVLGGGSTFTLRLPISAERPAPANPAANPVKATLPTPPPRQMLGKN